MKKLFYILISIITVISVGYFFRDQLTTQFFAPTDSNVREGIRSQDLESNNQITSEPNVTPTQEENIALVTDNLDIPWEIAFLPSGELLVTERPGILLKIGENRQVVQEIEGVEHVGEGGLMGMALHPDFENNQWLYLYLTSRADSGLINRVERYDFDGNSLSNKQIIIDNIPGAQYHDGGRMEFGPDEKLYLTTGDAGNEQAAQNTNTLHGKILRINDDGSVPEDNPFGNEVWSYGHRNPQGLAWDEQGRLWSTEHGPSGLQSGYDELNLIERGKNYGWPVIRGDETAEGMVSPVIHSGADDTWAPAGAIFYNGSIFFSGLRGASLYEAKIQDDKVTDLVAHFRNDYGRLRAVVLSPSDLIYISTSNTDGRGDENPNDDKIFSIRPDIFFNN